MRIRALIQGTGKTAAGMRIPDEVVAALGTSRKPAVRVTINGYTWRSTIASMGGEYWLGVSNENRRLSGTAAGDEVDVDLEIDTEPREVEAPADFAAALEREPEAKRFFDGLSYSNRLRHVLSIEDAKTPETRQRRIEKSVATLREGKV